MVRSFRRYVAIGDSSTEGLMDLDENGHFRGWADRLAQRLADAQPDPVEYANLAIRGLRLREIRDTQFDDAVAMEPDLLTVFAGVNDIIAAVRCDWTGMRADFAAMFGEARERGITVLTFTMPDPSRVNPFGGRLRPRAWRLNDVIREEAARVGALVLDFQQYPVAEDPRLWYEDRLHGNSLGHERVAAALAWRLGLPGTDLHWADPLPEELVRPSPRARLSEDLGWARTHLGPFLSGGLRGIRTGWGIEPKRPTPTVVPRSEPTSPIRSS